MRALPREESDLVQLKLRFREALRAKLEAAAARSGKSLNSEIVDRLEESIEREGLFRDPTTLRAIRLVINAIQTAEMRSMRSHGDLPKSWTEDPETGAFVVAACQRIFAAFAPGDLKSPAELRGAKLGRGLAAAMIDNLELAKAERLRREDEAG